MKDRNTYTITCELDTDKEMISSVAFKNKRIVEIEKLPLGEMKMYAFALNHAYNKVVGIINEAENGKK